MVSGQNGYNTPRLAATKPVGEDSSYQAKTLPELSEGKVSGGHFSACTGEVYSVLVFLFEYPVADTEEQGVQTHGDESNH